MVQTLLRSSAAQVPAPASSGPASADGRYRFWLSYMRLGFAVMIGMSLVDIAYVSFTVTRPHPDVVLLISIVDVTAGLAGFLLAPLLAAWRRRAEFAATCAVTVGVLTAVSAYADNGGNSPLTYIVMLPVIFAGAGLGPRAVTITSAFMVAELGVASSAGYHAGEEDGGHLVVLVGLAVSFGAIAVATAYQRRRLQQRELQLSAELRRSATVDDLTTALTYNAFQERLASEIAASVQTRQDLALIACDLDNLGAYNGVYGHVAGDAVLRAAADALISVAGGADIVGRVGGDELQLLCPRTSLDDAAAIARQALEEYHSVPRAVGLSIGVAQIDRSQPTPIRMLRDVDIALVEAKLQGGDRVVAREDVPTSAVPGELPGCVDCTAHRRLDAAVRHARRNTEEMRSVMHALVGGAPAGFAFISRDGEVRVANATVLAAARSRDPDPVGKPLAEVAPHLWPLLRAPFEHVLRTGAPVTGLELGGVPDGTTARRAWLTNLYPVHTGPDVTGVGVIAVDITDRKLLERASHDLTEAVVAALAATAEARDPYTAGHQHRVAELAVAIASRLNVSEDDVRGIRMAAMIHDIGKVAVPAELLARSGPLRPEEFALIKTHADIGYAILRDIPFPWPVAAMVRQHHERLDGSGYPLGLRGTDIMLGARIIAVADVVEAMAADRPYRPPLGIEVAIGEILAGRGKQYDGDAVDACIALHDADELDALINRHGPAPQT